MGKRAFARFCVEAGRAAPPRVPRAYSAEADPRAAAGPGRVLCVEISVS